MKAVVRSLSFTRRKEGGGSPRKEGGGSPVGRSFSFGRRRSPRDAASTASPTSNAEQQGAPAPDSSEPRIMTNAKSDDTSDASPTLRPSLVEGRAQQSVRRILHAPLARGFSTWIETLHLLRVQESFLRRLVHRDSARCFDTWVLVAQERRLRLRVIRRLAHALLAPVEAHASSQLILGRSSSNSTECSALMVPVSVRLARA